MAPLLIFCAGRNRRYAEIALAHGFAYGCRSDYRPLFPAVFADLNWRAPDLARHAAFVREHRPHLAVAPDVLRLDDLPAALDYADHLSEYAERVVLVPKCPGVIERLPREPWLVLGYSVPTRYGSVGDVPDWEFRGWPVHLLGGTPPAQLALAHYLDVYSADGNSHMKAAAYGSFWDGRRWASKRSGVGATPDLPYIAFGRSCAAIAAAWGRTNTND